MPVEEAASEGVDNRGPTGDGLRSSTYWCHNWEEADIVSERVDKTIPRQRLLTILDTSMSPGSKRGR